MAQYGATMGFNSFPTNSRGWQYTSSGQIDGIDGNVDMNAFCNKDYVSDGSDGDVVTYEVKGDMGKEWQSIGAEKSVIGRPIANEVCDWTSGRVNCYQNFENGTISWTPSTGAHYTTGEVRKEWARRNYEHGVLGYPIEDEKTLSNNWICQSFEHGYVWVQGTDTNILSYITFVILSMRMVVIRFWAVPSPTRRTWVAAIGVSIVRMVTCGPATVRPRSMWSCTTFVKNIILKVS